MEHRGFVMNMSRDLVWISGTVSYVSATMYSAVVPITGSCGTGPAPGTTSAARWTGETPTRSSGWRSGLDNYRCR